MKTRTHTIAMAALGLLAALVGLGACQNKAPAEAPATRAPGAPQALPQPADGAPVALAFAGLAAEGDAFRARITVSSFAAQPVGSLLLALQGYDASGALVGGAPWTHEPAQPLAPGATETFAVAPAFPPTTARVQPLVAEVRFADGTVWRPAEVQAQMPARIGKKPVRFELQQVRHLTVGGGEGAPLKLAPSQAAPAQPAPASPAAATPAP